MSRIKRDAVILVVVAILLGVAAYFAFPLSKTNLGLDLQGGSRSSSRRRTRPRNRRTEDGMDQAVEIIQNRVNKLGVAEPEIQRQGEDKISVQLPGIDNPEAGPARSSARPRCSSSTRWSDSSARPTPPKRRHWPRLGSSPAADALPADTTIVHWPRPEGGSQADQWFLVDHASLS